MEQKSYSFVELVNVFGPTASEINLLFCFLHLYWRGEKSETPQQPRKREEKIKRRAPGPTLRAPCGPLLLLASLLPFPSPPLIVFFFFIKEKRKTIQFKGERKWRANGRQLTRSLSSTFNGAPMRIRPQ